nr:nitroreductase family protein [Paenibacillus lemnae]
MEFSEIVKKRRSANNFLADHPITQKELDEIFDLVKLSPSAFNLQHASYIVVKDPAVKEQVKEAAFGQFKVSSASAVVAVLGNMKAYTKVSEIYMGLKMLGALTEEEYNKITDETISFYEAQGEAFQKEEAIRNASLSAMLFMLAAKEKGWDTCPMIGFDPAQIKNLLNVKEGYEVVMLVAVGKEKEESRRPRGYRKPVSEFVAYI